MILFQTALEARIWKHTNTGWRPKHRLWVILLLTLHFSFLYVWDLGCSGNDAPISLELYSEGWKYLRSSLRQIVMWGSQDKSLHHTLRFLFSSYLLPCGIQDIPLFTLHVTVDKDESRNWIENLGLGLICQKLFQITRFCWITPRRGEKLKIKGEDKIKSRGSRVAEYD